MIIYNTYMYIYSFLLHPDWNWQAMQAPLQMALRRNSKGISGTNQAAAKVDTPQRGKGCKGI
jgi:hypothetical protein